MTLKPCITCGELGENSRCTDCQTAHDRQYPDPRRRNTTSSGYDQRWRRLSERARKRQPFCSDCGRPDQLHADHLPIAWWRRDHGLPIRLRDIDVVCAACNHDRGEARPGSDRYNEWLKSTSTNKRDAVTRGERVTGWLPDPGAQGEDTVDIATVVRSSVGGGA